MNTNGLGDFISSTRRSFDSSDTKGDDDSKTTLSQDLFASHPVDFSAYRNGEECPDLQINNHIHDDIEINSAFIKR